MNFKNIVKDLIVNAVYMMIDSYSKTPKITLTYSSEEKEKKSTDNLSENSHVEAFSRDEAAEYTREMALEHLVAAEDHLRSARGKNTKLCVACLPPGTIIATNHPKPIEEVKVGDTVLTHKGLFRKVTKTFKRWYCGKMVKIKVRGYNVPLLVTPEHPILVSKNIYTWSRTFKAEMYGGKGRLDKPRWVPAVEVRPGYGIAFPKVRTVFNKTNKHVDLTNHVDKPLRHRDDRISIRAKGGRGRKWVKKRIPVNDSLLEFIGYYIAEGFIETQPRGKYVKLAFGKHEKNLVDRVRRLVVELFGFEPLIIEKRTAIVVHIGSYIVASWLEKEFGGKSYTKRLPAWFMYLPEDKLRRFLLAYIRGDGSIADDKRGYKSVTFATVSSYLALQLRTILYKLGVYHTIYYKDGGLHKIEGRTVKTRPIWCISIFADTCKLGIPVAKRRKWRYAIEMYDNVIVPVEKVELVDYEGWVYNLEVNEYNSYVTMWGALHNCLVENHFPALRQYAREGKKFCRTPEECEAYDRLLEVVNEVEQRLLSGDRSYEEMAEMLRAVRKMLSPAVQVLKAVERLIREGEAGMKTSPMVRIVENKSCIPDVKRRIESLFPKVAEAASRYGFRTKPVDISIAEGTVVKDGVEACAATNPDMKPVKQLYNCECWNEISEKEKNKIVAHELAHALGVKDEEEAEKITGEAVGK